MFCIVHALLGSLIGEYFSSMFIVIFLGVLSHFLLDLIPHWNGPYDKDNFKYFYSVKFNKINVYLVITDLLATIFLLFILHEKFHSHLMIFGAIAAILPDVANIGYFTKLKHKKNYKKLLYFHSNIQGESTVLLGILTQLIIVIVIMKIIF